MNVTNWIRRRFSKIAQSEVDKMDSDGELPEARRGGVNVDNKEDEMNKLRSDSASPSTFSTASSGSPLVRGSSGFSNIIIVNGIGNKRPAPTSIAAAQLQQQQQLEFTNRLLIDQQQQQKQVGMTSKKNSSKHSSAAVKHSASSIGKVVGKPEQRQQQTRVASSWSLQANIDNKSKSSIPPPPNYDGSKKVQNCEENTKNKNDLGDNKSFGYNVAKSLAFKAYR